MTTRQDHTAARMRVARAARRYCNDPDDNDARHDLAAARIELAEVRLRLAEQDYARRVRVAGALAAGDIGADGSRTV